MRDRKPMSVRITALLVEWLNCQTIVFLGKWFRAAYFREIFITPPPSQRGISQAISHAVKLLPAHGWTAERRRGKRGWEYRFSRVPIANGEGIVFPNWDKALLIPGREVKGTSTGTNIRCDCGAILGPLKIGKEKYRCSCGEVWLVDFDGFLAHTAKEVTPPDSCGNHGGAGRAAEVKEPQEVWVVRERRDGKPPRSMAVYDSQDEAFQMARSEAMKGITGVETGAYVPRVHHVEAFPDFSGGLHVAPPAEEYKCREIMDPNKWMTTIPVSDVRKRILDILQEQVTTFTGGFVKKSMHDQLIEWLRELEG